MRIAISTSVIQRGRSGVGQYVLALVRALLDQKGDHQLVLFVLTAMTSSCRRASRLTTTRP